MLNCHSKAGSGAAAGAAARAAAGAASAPAAAGSSGRWAPAGVGGGQHSVVPQVVELGTLNLTHPVSPAEVFEPLLNCACHVGRSAVAAAGGSSGADGGAGGGRLPAPRARPAVRRSAGGLLVLWKEASGRRQG